MDRVHWGFVVINRETYFYWNAHSIKAKDFSLLCSPSAWYIVGTQHIRKIKKMNEWVYLEHTYSA